MLKLLNLVLSTSRYPAAATEILEDLHVNPVGLKDTSLKNACQHHRSFSVEVSAKAARKLCKVDCALSPKSGSLHFSVIAINDCKSCAMAAICNQLVTDVQVMKRKSTILHGILPKILSTNLHSNQRQIAPLFTTYLVTETLMRNMR